MSCSVHKRIRIIVLPLFLTTGFLVQNSVLADLILSAPPRESVEAGKKLYEPLAESLSQLTGEKVIYQHPENWHNYQKRLQNDEFDIVFDGPHFAAWRMSSLKAKPLVRLPGNLRFVLVVMEEDRKITEPKHLVGKTVCTLPSPNLGALTLYSMYPNPVLQPEFRQVSGGFKQVTKELLAGKCRGAILRSSFFYKKLPDNERDSILVIKESAPIINQGITVSTRVGQESQSKMLKALTTSKGKQAMRPILDRFSAEANTFIPARDEEYVGKNLLYDNTVFGW